MTSGVRYRFQHIENEEENKMNQTKKYIIATVLGLGAGMIFWAMLLAVTERTSHCTITFNYENSTLGSFVRLDDYDCGLMRERCEQLKGCKYVKGLRNEGESSEDFRINYER